MNAQKWGNTGPSVPMERGRLKRGRGGPSCGKKKKRQNEWRRKTRSLNQPPSNEG